MIELHAWPTPNAFKISIFLEEAGVPFKTVPVDIGKGQQFEPAFLAISPNNRMPAIVDPDAPGDPWVWGMASRAPDLVADAPRVRARPAVVKGMDFMKEYRRTAPFTDEERKHLFERKA